jgi:hypothetical protein
MNIHTLSGCTFNDLVLYAFRMSASDVSSWMPNKSYGFTSSLAGIVYELYKS